MKNYIVVLFILIIGKISYLYISNQNIKKETIHPKNIEGQKNYSPDTAKNLCKLNSPLANDCKASSVGAIKCNINNEENLYYVVDYNCTDIPFSYYNGEGKLIASCGGMPLPDERRSSSICDDLQNKCSTGLAPIYCGN